MDIKQSLLAVKSLIDETLTLSVKDAYLKNIDIIIEMDNIYENKFSELKKLIQKECNIRPWQENTPSWYSRRLFNGRDYFENLSLTDLFGIVYDDVLKKCMDITAEIIINSDNPIQNKLNELIKLIWNAIGPDVKEYWVINELNKEEIDKLIGELIMEIK